MSCVFWEFVTDIRIAVADCAGCFFTAVSSKKRNKIRADFRKNRTSRSRQADLTRSFQKDELAADDGVRQERISGKGEVSRKRTVVGTVAAEDDTGFQVRLDVDESQCRAGRVLQVNGLVSTVEDVSGVTYRCATRRLLKTLATDQRHVVVAGDRVLFRSEAANEGVIERVEPRWGVLSRTSQGRQHVIVANVDQVLIVGSAAEPTLKPNLIDRMIVSAEKAGVTPIICVNKIDLVEAADLQPLVGVYSQMGYSVILASAVTGLNLDRLRRQLAGRQTVIAGQSGVGKSSLMNGVDPGLSLRVSSVSRDSQKGRHTTTTSQLIRLNAGGYVVDTPGIRQFQLWDVEPGEVAGFYRDLRPFVHDCRFPDCTHTHEADCAVKNAVADGWLDVRRYESYCQLSDPSGG